MRFVTFTLLTGFPKPPADSTPCSQPVLETFRRAPHPNVAFCATSKPALSLPKGWALPPPKSFEMESTPRVLVTREDFSGARTQGSMNPKPGAPALAKSFGRDAQLVDFDGHYLLNFGSYPRRGDGALLNERDLGFSSVPSFVRLQLVDDFGDVICMFPELSTLPSLPSLEPEEEKGSRS